MGKGYHKELEKMGISAEGAKTITETFLYYYLSPSLLSPNKCLEYTESWLNACRRDLLEEYQKVKSRLSELFR